MAVLRVGRIDPIKEHEEVAVQSIGQPGQRLDRLGKCLGSRVEHGGVNPFGLDAGVIEHEELRIVRELGVVRIGIAIVGETLSLVDDGAHRRGRRLHIADDEQAA